MCGNLQVPNVTISQLNFNSEVCSQNILLEIIVIAYIESISRLRLIKFAEAQKLNKKYRS